MDEEGEPCNPFNTMASLCEEYGLLYPLERQGARQHIENVGGFTGPALAAHGVDYQVSVVECNGNRTLINGEKRRMSSISRSASVIGKRARKFSGEISRRASKLLKMTSTPNVVRHGGRALMVDEDGELLDRSKYVSLGREVDSSEYLPPAEFNPAEGCFGAVHWPEH